MAKRYQRGNQNQQIDEEQTIHIVLSVLRRFTDSDCRFRIFWPLYCLFFVDLLILITPLQWPNDTKEVIRISKSTTNRQYNGQKISKGQSESVNRRRTNNGQKIPCIVCSLSIYWFWLPLWYLLTIVLCVLRRFTDSDCPFGIFWPLYYLFFVHLLILMTPLVSFGPKGQSESINGRRTDNTMAKRYQRGNQNQ
jgi:hypothetical protein